MEYVLPEGGQLEAVHRSSRRSTYHTFHKVLSGPRLLDESKDLLISYETPMQDISGVLRAMEVHLDAAEPFIHNYLDILKPACLPVDLWFARAES